MEDKELVQGQAGAVAYDVKFSEGKLVVSEGVEALGLKNVTSVDASLVLDALKAAIPGHFDDVVIDAAKAILLGK